MRQIPFVDAHVHHWDLDRLHYPWLTPPFSNHGPNGSVQSIASTYRPPHYREDSSAWNVVGTVHVEAGALESDAVAETQWLETLTDGPTGTVAFAPLNHPDVGRLIDRQASFDRVRGIRQIVNWHPEPSRTYTEIDVTLDPKWIEGFTMLARHGLSFDLQCYPAQMPRLADLFSRNPDTQVIVNHLGMPVLSDPDARGRWKGGLTALAALPNVAIKISGFGFIQRSWTAEAARPWILEAIDIFGTDRACVASDFPTDRLFGTFDDTLDAYASVLSPFSDAEKRALWGGNANRLYRLGLQLQDTHHG